MLEPIIKDKICIAVNDGILHSGLCQPRISLNNFFAFIDVDGTRSAFRQSQLAHSELELEMN